MKLRMYNTKGMLVPKLWEDFRVGPNIGKCVFKTPWFVIMLSK